MKQPIKFWVDGGMLGGHNPSPEGVFWSVYRLRPGSYGGVVIHREESTEYHTNNEAEWLALRAALRFATIHHKGHRLRIYSDSKLIVKQFSGKWNSNLLRLRRLRFDCQELAAPFPECIVKWRPRSEMVKRLGH